MASALGREGLLPGISDNGRLWRLSAADRSSLRRSYLLLLKNRMIDFQGYSGSGLLTTGELME